MKETRLSKKAWAFCESGRDSLAQPHPGEVFVPAPSLALLYTHLGGQASLFYPAGGP